jgi:hypothetical protein
MSSALCHTTSLWISLPAEKVSSLSWSNQSAEAAAMPFYSLRRVDEKAGYVGRGRSIAGSDNLPELMDEDLPFGSRVPVLVEDQVSTHATLDS